MAALRHVAAAFSILALLGAAGLVYYARDLPSTEGLWSVERRPSLRIEDRSGDLVSVYGLSHGAPVRLKDLPPHVPNAVIALEDRNFRHHIGVNPLSVLRALSVNAREGEIRQGASTITQQLAKNLFLTSERTIKRKVQEIILAFWLEGRFTKDEILTLYLNRVYFGAGAYGIEAASERYFGKSAAALSVGEAAVMAGLLKAPSRYAPTTSPDGAAGRGTLALDAMVEAGFLTPAERIDAAAEPIRVAPSAATPGAAWFVDYVAVETRRLIGAYETDLIVETTLDLAAQEKAEAAIAAAYTDQPLMTPDLQAALVGFDEAGGVLAMIGGRSYTESEYNRAVTARRQPGSAFKPFVYLAALEAGFSPRSRVKDAPLNLGGWSPENYADRYYGNVTLSFALAKSLNTATVRVSERVGPGRAAEAARRLGVRSNLRVHRSLPLGVSEVSLLELAGAYGAFANGGHKMEPHVVSRIRTGDGRLVYERPPAAPQRVIDARNAQRINAMLARVVEDGTGRRAALSGRNVIGKTGTSQNYRDAWFIGAGGGLTAGVWVGRDDNAPMDKVTGGTVPADIWRAFAAGVLEERSRGPVLAEAIVSATPVAVDIEEASVVDVAGPRTMEDLLSDVFAQ